MPITRRSLLGLVSSSTFFLTARARRRRLGSARRQSADVAFPQGVASGDPQADAVMLWTRALPAAEASRAAPAASRCYCN